jgi:spore coat polysaccharide biosynthesis predicted glycosyltransferase SpsG
MRYVIRADASKSIGAGHVMRCSAVAEELIARGEIVIFVGQTSELPWVKARIASLKFTHTYENPNEFTSNANSDVLIIDSYIISTYNYFITPSRWLSIVAIVDEETPEYSCQLRIHPGLDSNWVGTSTVPILAGPKYIPFRSSLLDYVYVPHNQNHLKIAVVAGGSDPYGLVKAIARILSEFTGAFEVHLFSKELFDLTLDERFHYHEIGYQLDEVTKDVDLVLTTSSSSSLEFIARGLCVGAICVVDNQMQNYKSFHKLEIAAQVGIRNSDEKWEFDEKIIHKLLTSTESRASLTEKATGYIDFRGAERIVDAIEEVVNKLPINS